MIFKRAKLMFLIIITISSIIDTHACVMTLINDKAGKLIVYNKVDKTLIFMRKNERRRFGNQRQPAFFALYLQQPKKQIFSRVYTCKQTMCSDNGNIQLKLSDIENGTESTEFFQVIKNAPYASMAQKYCESCSSE